MVDTGKSFIYHTLKVCFTHYMVKLSKQSDYGLQLLAALTKASPDNPVSLRQLSDERSISFLFLQRIASSLRKAGYIDAKKGSKGGYFLTTSLDDVSVGQVITTLDGTYALAACQMQKNVCNQEADCPILPGITRLHTSFSSQLHALSVADFLAP